MVLDKVMSRQTKNHSLIYYEMGINNFNWRLSHMKHNRHTHNVAYNDMKRLKTLSILVHRTRNAWTCDSRM